MLPATPLNNSGDFLSSTVDRVHNAGEQRRTFSLGWGQTRLGGIALATTSGAIKCPPATSRKSIGILTRIVSLRTTLGVGNPMTRSKKTMEVLEESSYNESIGFFAPLPLFGLDFWWSYTERWGDRPHHRFLQRRLGICAGHLNPRGLQTEQPIGCADWYEIFLCQRGLER